MFFYICIPSVLMAETTENSTDTNRWFWKEQFLPSFYDMGKTWPKISIVTPTFNQGQYIEETILSIVKQNYPNLEYFVIDGGSNDNTVESIKKYEKHLTYWVSEPDKGQANAINKGLEMATGEIFHWINSDDYLEKGALFEIAKAFVETGADVVAGKTVYFENERYEAPIQQAKLSAKGLIKWEKGVKFVQPGVWLKKEGIVNCMGIDEQFHYAFDWDLLIRYLCKHKKVTYIDSPFVFFRLHKNSKTVSVLDKFREEEERIIKKIIEIPKFSLVHNAGKFRLRRTEWYGIINTLSKTNKSKLVRIYKIIINSLKLPSVRVNRITFGAIKNILLNK